MLDQFEGLVKKRSSCRFFEKKDIPEKLIERLLDITRYAPSSYNLQPVHFFVVRSEKIKHALFVPCLKQEQVLSAPCLVVFALDRKVVEHNAESLIRAEMKTGSFTEEKARRFRVFTRFGFDSSKFGWIGFFKRLFTPIIRWKNVLPNLPLENFDAWLAKQSSLSCMTFMLAAEAAGLSTCAMEAFDEKKLKKVLGLDSSWYVPLVVAVGYGNQKCIKASRLPLSELMKWI